MRKLLKRALVGEVFHYGRARRSSSGAAWLTLLVLIYVSIYLWTVSLNAPNIPTIQIIAFLAQPCTKSGVIQRTIMTMIHLEFTVRVLTRFTSSGWCVTTSIFASPIPVQIVASSTSAIFIISMPYVTSKLIPFQKISTLIAKTPNCILVGFE